MQMIYEAIKDYLTTHTEFTQEEKLPALKDKDFYFGVVDLLRRKGSIVVAIVPDTENEVEDTDEDDLSGYQTDTRFTVAFICREDKQSVLDDKVVRYAHAFRKAVLTDTSLDGALTGSELGERKFYFDAGTVEQQMSAVEITFTTRTTTTLN